ncbi:MAG: adenosylcobinamide-GDP ribazoletransferase [Hyphomicrobiaceae bacterium]
MNVARDWVLQRLAEARIALMTLTRLPGGRVRPPVPATASTVWAFPLVGLIIGGLSATAYAVAHAAHLPPPLAAVVAIATGIALTGALHEDGLADTADGLGGGQDRIGKLAIMRDSHVGSYGILTLILSLAARAVCIAALDAPHVVAGAMIALASASRTAMVIGLFAMPSARTDGLGKSASGVAMPRCVIAGILGLVALAAFTSAWPIIAISMIVVGLILASLAWRQIGGQTGDVLGAIQQSTEIIGWVVIVSWSSVSG